MPCTICHHPKRQEIDQALAAGSATLAALGRQYNLSTSALHRHKAHLQDKVSRARDRIRDNLRQGCLFWLGQAADMVMRTAQAAEAQGNSKLVLQATQLGARLIALCLKYDLPLDDDMVYSILCSPQWASQASLLPHDPNVMAMSRQATTASLAADCPEGPASPPASPEEDALIDQILHLLAAESAQSACENRPTKTARGHQKREKSGKLPGKIPARKDNSEEYQEDDLLKKIAGITDYAFLGQPLSPGTGSSKLDAALREMAANDKIPGGIPLSEYLLEPALPAGLETSGPAA